MLTLILSPKKFDSASPAVYHFYSNGRGSSFMLCCFSFYPNYFYLLLVFFYFAESFFCMPLPPLPAPLSRATSHGTVVLTGRIFVLAGRTFVLPCVFMMSHRQPRPFIILLQSLQNQCQIMTDSATVLAQPWWEPYWDSQSGQKPFEKIKKQ